MSDTNVNVATPVETTTTAAPDSSGFSDAELSRILSGQEEAPSTEPAEVKETPAEALTQPTEEVKPPTEGEDNKFAPKFSALAKKEKAILEQQRALKAQEEALKAESARTAKLAAALEKLSKDPIGTLEELGVDPATLYADLTEQSLSGSLRGRKAPSEDVMASVKAEIEALKKELVEHEMQKERQQGIANAHRVVESDPDRWAYIQANGVQTEVWNLIEAWHQETGEVLDYKTAADKVEAYLESEAQKYIAATQRKQQRQAQPQQAQPKQPALATQPSTLTNAMAVKTPPSLEDDWEKTVIDPRERKERLLKELAELKIV